jgi:hypothetical protein
MSERNPDRPGRRDESSEVDINTTAASDKFIIEKKNQIKKAVDNGNKAKARRHATEIMQFLGEGDDEMPIDDMLEPLE